ncbi:NAD-dependent epimerase [Candidatus Pacearchaeota archaeon]|nr:NAD-dependent epimerase [Candidatus Pacearchaeota archaeon]|tara:strand:- start:7035 stop:8111 length:1077 start_codon:yes stop_codon:yes gene_type:complete
MTEDNYKSAFKGKNIMITGGLGFIGSNLAHALAPLSPERIVIVDSYLEGHGANKYNLSGIEDIVEIPSEFSGGIDIRDNKNFSPLLSGIDYIFNLAGSISHIGSKKDPLKDLQLNLESHVSFLQSCRTYVESGGKPPKIIFGGTRDQYGKLPESTLPVRENTLHEDPADPQGIHNQAAEFHHLWYRNFGIQASSLRLTNTFGPRHPMQNPSQGFLNWFIRLALENKEIELWGGGEALRDFNYVDDVTEAFLRTMASDETDGNVYNLGSYIRKSGRVKDMGDNARTVSEAAHAIVEKAGSGSCRVIPYPEDKKAIEPGHFCADATKIYEEVGWLPRTSFQEGIEKTLGFYKSERENYNF